MIVCPLRCPALPQRITSPAVRDLPPGMSSHHEPSGREPKERASGKGVYTKRVHAKGATGQKKDRFARGKWCVHAVLLGEGEGGDCTAHYPSGHPGQI